MWTASSWGKGAHDCGWLRSLRTNSVRYTETPDAKENRATRKGEMLRICGAALVPHPTGWVCLCTRGQSVVHFVPEAAPERRAREALARGHQEEINQCAQNVGGMADVSVVYKKSTNGYTADPETLQPLRRPWLRMRVVSAYLRPA